MVFTVLMMCVHLYLISKCFDHSKKKSYTHEAVTTHFPLPTPRPYKPLTCFLPLQICPFWTFHINGIIGYVLFCDYLLLLNMFPRLTHVVTQIKIPFHFIAEWHCTVQKHHILFIHSSVGNVGCFYFLALPNDAATNTYIQVFVRTCFHFSWVDTGEWNCWIVG